MKWRSLQPAPPSPDTRPLREQFAERKALIQKYVPPEIQAIHRRTVEALRQGALSSSALPAGAHAPVFELSDHHGATVSSAQLVRQGPLVVCFFRGRWCPFCVGQLEAMDQALPQIQARGAALVAISPQTVQQSFFMADQHRLRFPLLSDAGSNLARSFGLAYTVPPEQQAVYKRVFINLPFTNGHPGWELPVPATYIIGQEGAVVAAWHDVDYTERPEPSDILRALGQRPFSSTL